MNPTAVRGSSDSHEDPWKVHSDRESGEHGITIAGQNEPLSLRSTKRGRRKEES